MKNEKIRITSDMLPAAVAPGQFLMDELEAREVEYSEFAKAYGNGAPTREAMLSGAFVITPEVADRLAAYFEIPAYLWLGLEESFRSKVAAGKPVLDARDEPVQNGKILLRVPRSLHGRAVRVAKAEGVSLNQLISSYVAECLGRMEAAESEDGDRMGRTKQIRKEFAG